MLALVKDDAVLDAVMELRKLPERALLGHDVRGRHAKACGQRARAGRRNKENVPGRKDWSNPAPCARSLVVAKEARRSADKKDGVGRTAEGVVELEEGPKETKRPKYGGRVVEWGVRPKEPTIQGDRNRKPGR